MATAVWVITAEHLLKPGQHLRTRETAEGVLPGNQWRESYKAIELRLHGYVSKQRCGG